MMELSPCHAQGLNLAPRWGSQCQWREAEGGQAGSRSDVTWTDTWVSQRIATQGQYTFSLECKKLMNSPPARLVSIPQHSWAENITWSLTQPDNGIKLYPMNWNDFSLELLLYPGYSCRVIVHGDIISSWDLCGAINTKWVDPTIYWQETRRDAACVVMTGWHGPSVKGQGLAWCQICITRIWVGRRWF